MLASRQGEALERALVVGGFLVLLLLLPHALQGDDLQRLADIEALLYDGALSDGRYSLVMPLLSSPFVLIGSVVGSPEWWAARFNVFVVAAGSYIVWRLLRHRINGFFFRRLLLVLLFASYLTNRLRDYNAEVLTATLVIVGIVCLVTGQRPVLGWAVIVLGVVNTPGAVLGLVALAGVETFRTRRLRQLLPVLAGAVLIMTEAWIRRGDALASGYENDHGVATALPTSGLPGFSFPLALGVLAILFSFGRGLVFFAPGLLLWLGSQTRRLGRRYRLAIVLMLAFLAGLVALYAKWWAWYGGISWGPRFFVFAAVPASLFIALRLRGAGRSSGADAATLAVLALSAWVGVAGAISDPGVLSRCARSDYAFEAFCWYAPEFSSLLRPLSDLRGLTPATAILVAYCGLVFVYLARPLIPGPARALATMTSRSFRGGGWRL